MRIGRLLCLTLICLSMGSYAFSADIVHDGEFNFVKAQYQEAWAQQDKRIDTKLAQIRKEQGGKRPNIFTFWSMMSASVILAFLNSIMYVAPRLLVLTTWLTKVCLSCVCILSHRAHRPGQL